MSNSPKTLLCVMGKAAVGKSAIAAELSNYERVVVVDVRDELARLAQQQALDPQTRLAYVTGKPVSMNIVAAMMSDVVTDSTELIVLVDSPLTVEDVGTMWRHANLVHNVNRLCGVIVEGGLARPSRVSPNEIDRGRHVVAARNDCFNRHHDEISQTIRILRGNVINVSTESHDASWCVRHILTTFRLSLQRQGVLA